MPTITTKELTTLKIAKRHHHTIKSRFAIVHYATDHGIAIEATSRTRSAHTALGCGITVST